MKHPPDKQWQLLELAYADFKSVEMDPAYRVDMMVFHTKNPWYPECYVCLAGAVMARTLQVPINTITTPIDFTSGWKAALYNISSVALGDLPSYTTDVVAKFIEQHYKPYKGDPAAWHNYITGLIQLLKELDV